MGVLKIETDIEILIMPACFLPLKKRPDFLLILYRIEAQMKILY